MIQLDNRYEMYRVKWPDNGDISDMVNLTRAKEAIRVYLDNRSKTDSRMPAKCPRKAADAFK